MTLTIADIERWDAGDVREVFHAATTRAQAVQDAANGLAQLPAFTTWGGEAAEAAKEAIGKTRADLDAHGRETLAVANAARSAADEIERLRSELATLKADAAALGMEIDPVSGQVVAGPGFRGTPMELLLKQQQLQPRVDVLIGEANLVDLALANAIDMASGETPAPGQPPASTKPPAETQPGDQTGAPNSLEDMLVPPAARGSADGEGGTPSEILAGGTTTDPRQLENLDDALTDVAGQPVPVPPTAADRVLSQLTGEPEDGTPYTLSPLAGPIAAADPSVVNRQFAKVEAAKQNVDAAQAALNDAAAENYTAGAGDGPGRGVTDLLTQKLFDARRELTDQTKILEDLDFAVTESGGRGAAIPALPPNADVQSLPPEPSKLAEASRAISEGSFGIIPDYVETADVLTNWGEHSGAEQTGAILDIAGSVPLPGGKLVTEGVEHGLDALGVLGRHADDIPTPHVDVDDVPSSPDVPHTDLPDGAADDIGSVGSYGIEDTNALLTASEASGGHLIEKHVGQSFDDLAARLEAEPLPKAVSTFATTDEAAAAVSTTLQHNQSAIESWVSNGAAKTLVLTAPFDGGEVLVRGKNEIVHGTEALVVLRGDGAGGWYVLTGYMNR
ncbi:RNase A-like domain-containing protein [Mycolicibacterium mengxianglii]|uniref:RNase A-like domain-containing protein n=1 Tax=Mycolicibacterium mengxianglii TaxID=2736649 RepID=UPI0018D15EC9|nr:RNase A-like domain-containing protein [Mycolicibacterium mengxianglii]